MSLTCDFQLWSWVSLLFGMIFPLLLMVDCSWILRGVSGTPGIDDIFPIGRGIAKLHMTCLSLPFEGVCLVGLRLCGFQIWLLCWCLLLVLISQEVLEAITILRKGLILFIPSLDDIQRFVQASRSAWIPIHNTKASPVELGGLFWCRHQTYASAKCSSCVRLCSTGLIQK